MQLDDIHIDDAVGFTEKIFEMEPGSNKLHVKLGGIDGEFHIDGSLKLLKFIPFDIAGVKITGMTIDVTLESTASEDNVHWSLSDTSKFSFKDLKFQMKSSKLQKLVNFFSGTIAKVIKFELPQISKALHKVVKNLDAKIANEGPLTFAAPLYGNKAINLTMTHSPELSNDLVKIYFDGLILNNNESYTNTKGIQTPPRLQHNVSEQIWLNERMVDTVFNSFADKIFPITFNNSGITTILRENV